MIFCNIENRKFARYVGITKLNNYIQLVTNNLYQQSSISCMSNNQYSCSYTISHINQTINIKGIFGGGNACEYNINIML